MTGEASVLTSLLAAASPYGVLLVTPSATYELAEDAISRAIDEDFLVVKNIVVSVLSSTAHSLDAVVSTILERIAVARRGGSLRRLGRWIQGPSLSIHQTAKAPPPVTHASVTDVPSGVQSPSNPKEIAALNALRAAIAESEAKAAPPAPAALLSVDAPAAPLGAVGTTEGDSVQTVW
jgi:hypothetical protein